MADHHACCDPGASLQLTGQADFWHPTGKGTVLIADLDDRPALRVTLAPACQQLYLTVSLSAADVWPCGPGGAFLAAASRVPGEQPSAGGLGRADGSNAARQCRGSWTVRSIKNAWTACGTSPRGAGSTCRVALRRAQPRSHVTWLYTEFLGHDRITVTATFADRACGRWF